MASINSPIRKFLKPILYKLFGQNLYIWFQYKAKVRDIELRLIDEIEMDLLPYFINKNSEVLDIGANYAYYSVLMGRLGKKIYAYEPIPFTHLVCKKVIKHFKLKNVELFSKGVGAKNEKMTFSVPVVDFGAMSAGQAHMANRNNELEGKSQHYKFNKQKEFECEVVSIDDTLLPTLSNLTFVKMDIEGAEYFALEGMKKTIQKFKPVVLLEINPFFLNGFNIEESKIKQLIKDLGYTIYRCNESKKLEKYTTAFIESNYIIIPDEKIFDFNKIIQS
jgi:FkbM family methyltransferase